MRPDNYWTFHADGSVDLRTPFVSLLGLFPALDHAPLRTTGVAIERFPGGGKVTYTTLQGVLELAFVEAEGGLAIRPTLRDWTAETHWLYVAANARITGARKLFRQGMGFSGPTGFIDLTHGAGESWAWDSYLMGGLIAEDGNTLAMGIPEHLPARSRFQIYNRRHTYNFRNREHPYDEAFFEAGFALEKTKQPPEVNFPTLYFQTGGTPWQTMRNLAFTVARVAGVRPLKPATCHWCSWYHRGHYLTQEELETFLDNARERKLRLDSIQIDDGYQPWHGDWLEHNDRWPGGLEAAFESIRTFGYNPGIWVGPFMVQNRSRLYREHPDWVLHDHSGKPVVKWANYEATNLAEETYILDTSHPDALAYLGEVFRQLRGWGATFFKTDFTEWGFVDSTQVRRHTPGKTSAQYFDEALRTIREAIGEDAHWLACISFFAPFLPYADSVRVTSDVGETWPMKEPPEPDGEGGGVPNVIAESLHTQYFNQVLWQNDPDVTYLRDYHMHMKPSEVRALALFNGMLGGSVNTSDHFHKLTSEQLALWQFIEPGPGTETARPPFWGQDRPLHTLVRFYPEIGGAAVLFLNPHTKTETEYVNLRKLCNWPKATVFEWGPEGAKRLGSTNHLYLELPAHEARLYYLHPQGEAPPAGMTLGGKMG